MKKIINGKVYYTATAKQLGIWENFGDSRDFHYVCEKLYQKRTGEYFLHGEGGAMTQYAVSCGSNSWRGGEKIMPLTVADARQWAEEHLDADEYEEIFGIPDEDGEKSTVCVQLPSAMVAQIKAGAAENGMSMVSYIESLLKKVL